MSSDQFTVYRSRLINQNLVVPAGHGLLRFTLPFIAEWVRQRALADDLVVGEMISGSSVAPPNGPELAARAAEAIERHKQEKPRCNHIGARSGHECRRPLGHNGPHRYT